MRNFLCKYKKEFIIFFFGLVIYFSLGLLYSYYLGIYKYWNVLFDIDTPRVFDDLTSFSANHYRTAVHPLFVLFFQPICKFLNLFAHDYIFPCLFLQSIFASLSLVCVFKILNNFKLNNRINYLLLLLFGLSFGQIVFSSSIETYIFAQGFLLLMWLFFSYKFDKSLNIWDYILIVMLGICSLSVTVTNFFQFIICVFFGIFLNKNEKNNILKSLIVLICVITFSVFLADIQNIFWPSAPNFFTKSVSDFISGNSEETLYITKTFGLDNFINIFNASFSHSLNLSQIYFLKTGTFLFFKNSFVVNIISICIFLSFIILNLYFILKKKPSFKSDKFYFALCLSLLFNWGLHLVYGNGSAFLYICHFNFLIILIIGYLIKQLNLKFFSKKIVFYVFSIIVIFSSLIRIINMFLILLPRFNVIDYFRILPLFLLFLCFVILTFILFDNKKISILFSILFLLLISFIYVYINHSNFFAKNGVCDEFCQWNEKYVVYEKQLKDFKNDFMIESYEDRDEPIGIMYFGMADRRKIVYKNGKLIDGKTHEIIKEFNYDDELIVPNEYSVILKDDDVIYRITENQDGVYLYTNGVKEKITSGKYKINLPEFDNYKYSEIMKVLHQEILFNIDGSEPKPNVFGYKQAYYRDAMLVSMALEETKNISILSDWVNGLNKVYDNSRSEDIDEVDNLGELLYIIGATGVNRPDLVNKIIDEIEHLKDSDGFISGMVDGSIQKYYPTLLAIFGANKLNINVDLNYPVSDDAYAKLTWYSDYRIPTNITYSERLYPYLSWGFYHYSGYGKLFMLDEIYPLTYEGGENSPNYKLDKLCFISDYYCEHDLYISHLWSASEMFLFLKDY